MLLPLIKFTIDKNTSIYEAFHQAMRDFYRLSTIKIEKREDLFFIDNLLYNWVSIMSDRRKKCEAVLSEGGWDECYFTTKFACYEINAMITFKG